MSAPVNVILVEESVTIVLDESLTPETASPIKYQTKGGLLAENDEYDGFVGSSPLHGFILAVHEAFSRHLTFELSPDDLWSLIVQGLGEHVSKNPEKHRSKLVKHAEGKTIVRIIRNDFVRGATTRENWMGVVHELTEATLKGATDDSIIHSVQQSYSTTTPIHRLLYAGSVLSTLQHYNDYRVQTRCGIPRIVLKGALSDWQKLLTNLTSLNLSQFDSDLATWDEVLCGLVTRIVEIRSRMQQQQGSADGVTKEDIQFFKNIYKLNQASGGDIVSGWVTGFFPYLGSKGTTDVKKLTQHLAGNLALLDPKTADKASVELSVYSSKGPKVASDVFSSGLVDIPFIWEYLGTNIPMTIYVGFDDPLVDATTSRPRVGFSVSYNQSK